MEETTMFELADQLVRLRAEKKRQEDELKELNAKIDEVNDRLVEMMVGAEMQSFNRAGRLFYLSTRTFASPAKDNKDALCGWLRANGYGDLVRETVYAQSLAAFVRELLDEDDELPADLADLVNVYEKTTVGIRKA